MKHTDMIEQLTIELSAQIDTSDMNADLLSQQTCAVYSLEMQLRDKNNEITALQSTADQVKSLQFQSDAQVTVLNNHKAKLEEEVSQLVQENRELRNKYENLKDDNHYLEDRVQRLKNNLYHSQSRNSSCQYHNRNYKH